MVAPKFKCGSPTNGGGWDGISFYVGEKPLNKYSCGYQFIVKKYEKIKFVSGGYNCFATGADTSCNAKINGYFYKDDVLIQTLKSFNFSAEVLSFTVPGNYKIVLKAKCKSDKCDSSSYYFRVL